MQFERLRKSHKKPIIIGVIAICVIGAALTFSLTKAKYRVDGSIDLAKGTTNYKAYDFKIIAMYKSDDKENYIEIEEMPNEGYVINEERSYCTTDNKIEVKGKVKTIDGNHSISKLKKNDKCYLYFDIDTRINVDDIIASFGSNLKSGIPNFSQTATGVESEDNNGIYITDDPMYGTNAKSYYWRGAATTNYVKLANFCWRIVRINGDKSIRLIYDGSTCHANGESTTDSIAISNVAYNLNYDQSNYVGWTYSGTSQRTLVGTSSNAKIQLESWYSSSITGANADKIADGMFCNDRNIGLPVTGWGSGYNSMEFIWNPICICNSR